MGCSTGSSRSASSCSRCAGCRRPTAPTSPTDRRPRQARTRRDSCARPPRTPARAIAATRRAGWGSQREQRCAGRPLVRPPAARGHGRAPAPAGGARRLPGGRPHARRRPAGLGEDRAAERVGRGARRRVAHARAPPRRPATALVGRLRSPGARRPRARWRRSAASARGCADPGGAPRPPLVLDDLDVLRGPALASLGELLLHGGDALHVVAASRSDPDLPLERLRLSGRLGELRAAELAFTLPEAAALLDALGLESLGEELVARLLERTEGWAAGLRLAGLSLRGEADPDRFVAEFAGDDRAGADYLTGEVLAGLPPATRELLLRTSIAGRISGGLADALTGGTDGALVLEQLDHSGTFVVPLDRHPTWFRYHALFAELLRARLRLERPGLEPELHAHAAAWLADAGFGREAMRHALAAGGPGSAAALIADHWLEVLIEGTAPPAVLAAAERGCGDARLAVLAAAACLSLGDAGGATAQLEGVVDGDGDAGRIGALLRARAAGDLARVRGTSSVLLRDSTPGHVGDALRALTLFHHGAAEFERGRLEVAAEQLEGAAAIAVDGEREGLRLGCLGRRAALEVADGGLRRADAAARAALALAEPRGSHRTAPA